MSARCTRCVIKVGSGVLAGGGAALQPYALRRLAGELAALRRAGTELVLVSSGAILAGRDVLGLARRPTETALKQAAAAAGQPRLMAAWQKAFTRHRVPTAQMLLTREDLRQRGRYLNARQTLEALLKLGALPVINENDTVAVEEIRFGDNDVLSALVANMCHAELLVLLTDQEGLYTADPRRDAAARLIARVDGEAAARIGRAGPAGSGGMESKVKAARIAALAGIPALIASGLRPGVLEAAVSGSYQGTLFVPRPDPLARRRAWLAFASEPRGRVHVDAGAREALSLRAKSLLASGVRLVEGRFERGEVVSLVEGGREFARGVCNYAAGELERIKGLKSAEAAVVLGGRPASEVVHRDRLALLA